MSISISSHQQIRHRAYEIFLERRNSGRKGDAFSDWLEAEEEIRRQPIPFGRESCISLSFRRTCLASYHTRPTSPAFGTPFASWRERSAVEPGAASGRSATLRR
jgi:hypothetical protein